MKISIKNAVKIECALALYPRTLTGMNIIFDLNGILFDNECQQGNMAACAALQTINPTQSAHVLRLLNDCITHGNRLFVISNWTQELYEFMSEVPCVKRILEKFDDVILSEAIGFNCSDPRIFNYLIDKHRLDPRQCIVVENSQLDLHAAGQVGISRTILCTNLNVTKIRQELQFHGALSF